MPLLKSAPVHACCYSRTLAGSFQGVKTILRYMHAYSSCSEITMLLTNQYSKEVNELPITTRETARMLLASVL